MKNTNSNISFQSSLPVIGVESSASGVKCNGGNGVLGHPEVYYSFDGRAEVTCLYCGQNFVKSAS